MKLSKVKLTIGSQLYILKKKEYYGFKNIKSDEYIDRLIYYFLMNI